MAKLVDRDSLPAAKNELMLFSVPPTQVAVVHSFEQEFSPKNSLEGQGSVRFEIPANPAFLDVAHNALYCKFRLVRDNDAVMVCDGNNPQDRAGPINYIGNTYFNQMKVYVGGKLLWDSGDTYHYKAFLEALMGFDYTTKQSFLKSALFTCDQPGTQAQNNNNVSFMEDMANTGIVTRLSFARNSAEFETMATLHCDPFNQERLFPNRMNMAIELFRNPNALVVHSDIVHNYKLKLVDCKFFLRMVETTPTLTMAFESQLLKMPAKIPIRRTEIKVLHMAVGRQDLPSTHLHSGQLPRRVVVAMVRSDAFIGDYSLSPFNFKNFGLSRISLSAGGKDYPPSPLEVDFAHNRYVQAYHMMYQAMKGNAEARTFGITWEQFKFGCGLYCFDLSPDSSGSAGYFQLISEGSVELKMRFSNPLDVAATGARGINILTYLEFDNMINIDRFRQPHIDYVV